MSLENLAAMVIGAAYPGVLTNNQIMGRLSRRIGVFHFRSILGRSCSTQGEE
jgi:hypothetical protein